MPPAVVAVGAAAMAASAAYTAGIVIFGTTLIAAGAAAAVVAGGVVLGLSAASGSFSSPKKPSSASLPSIANVATDRTLSIRQAITARRRAYGIVRLSGAQTFVHVTGDSKEYLHIVITMAGHPFRSVLALQLDDEIVPLDANGDATGKYAGFVRAKFGLGTTAGDAAFNAELIANCPDKWTSAHRQTGCAKIYVRLKFDRDIFPGSLPNISVIAETACNIQDPRVSGSPTEVFFTDNWALCVADYLLTPVKDGGLGATWDEIDTDDLISAANSSDEMAARKAATVTFTADASTNIITVADKSAALRLGTRLTLTTTGTVPGGTALATNYFWVPTGYLTGKLATSLVNARAGTVIDLTDAGSGTHTINVNAEPRYTCNGTFDTSESPQDITKGMLTAGAGAVVWAGGKWRIYAGVWRSSSVSFGKGDTDGGLTVQTRRSRKDLANGIKGVFSNPDDNFQPTDLPAYLKSSAVEEDNGEEIWLDYELPFTNSPSAGQRIHRIVLERNRRQISTKWPLNLRGLRAQAMSTVSMSNDLWGWTDKTFEVSGLSFAMRDGRREDEAPRFGIDLTMSEIDANVFAWDPTIDEATLTPSPTTDLPDPFVVAEPTSITVSSGTAQLYTRLDGTIFSRMLVRWTAPADAFVTSGGRIQGQKRGPMGESPAPDWVDAFDVPGDSVDAYILDVQDGQDFEVRLRSVNSIGIKSDWTTEVSHTVVGKTAPPNDVTGFSAQQNGTRLTFRWNQVPDLDLAGYEIRYMADPFVWADANVVTSVTRGTLVTNEFVPPGDWVLGIKARDTSENYSNNAATFSISVANSNDVIYDDEEYPRWAGGLDGFIRHDVSGYLLPSSTVLASAMSDEDLWDRFNAFPVSEAIYTGKVVDVGFDASGLRVWADMTGALGPGETAGSPDPTLYIDYRTQAGSFDGYEPWTIGKLSTAARYVATQARILGPAGAGYLRAFKPVVDVEERTQAVSQSVAAGGTVITFSPPFHSTPRPSLTAEAVGSPIEGRYVGWSDLSGTGGTFHVFNPAGQSVGGTISGDIVGA